MVVDLYASSGQPVGSRVLSEAPELGYGPSTIRNELAVLEEQGLLAHPNTSAGRVPTDAGHRYYVDRLLPSAPRRDASVALELTRREVDEAMRVTSETLSQVTNLMAVVSAPPVETSTIRHIEVLPLQPQLLMVVVITSTGGVSKRVLPFDEAVDPGLVAWGAAYLNDRLAGMGLGAQLALACALRIATSDARFAVPVLSSNLCGLWWLLRETGHRGGSEEFNEAARPLLDQI